MQIAFGRVRRKTSPAAVKYQTLLCSDVFGLYYKRNIIAINMPPLQGLRPCAKTLL